MIKIFAIVLYVIAGNYAKDIKNLDSPVWVEREKASSHLRAEWPYSAYCLYQAAEKTESAEVYNRADTILWEEANNACFGFYDYLIERLVLCDDELDGLPYLKVDRYRAWRNDDKFREALDRFCFNRFGFVLHDAGTYYMPLFNYHQCNSYITEYDQELEVAKCRENGEGKTRHIQSARFIFRQLGEPSSYEYKFTDARQKWKNQKKVVDFFRGLR